MGSPEAEAIFLTQTGTTQQIVMKAYAGRRLWVQLIWWKNRRNSSGFIGELPLPIVTREGEVLRGQICCLFD